MEDKKFFITLGTSAFAIFLGAFFAFLAVFGHIDRISTHTNSNIFMPMAVAQSPNFSELDKAIARHQKMINEMDRDFENLLSYQTSTPYHKIQYKSPNVETIKTEKTQDNIKVIIDLKPFNKDPKNVNVTVKNQTVSIEAKYEAKDKNAYDSTSVFQSFKLPEPINEKNIIKAVNNDVMTITIPRRNNTK